MGKRYHELMREFYAAEHTKKEIAYLLLGSDMHEFHDLKEISEKQMEKICLRFGKSMMRRMMYYLNDEITYEAYEKWDRTINNLKDSHSIPKTNEFKTMKELLKRLPEEIKNYEEIKRTYYYPKFEEEWKKNHTDFNRAEILQSFQFQDYLDSIPFHDMRNIAKGNTTTEIYNEIISLLDDYETLKEQIGLLNAKLKDMEVHLWEADELFIQQQEIFKNTFKKRGKKQEEEKLKQLEEDIKQDCRLKSPSEYAKYQNGRDDGYIYMIKEQKTFTYKIGMTRHLKSRSDAFGVNLPFEWEYIAIVKVDNRQKTEALIHKKYERYRKNGEWFSFNKENLKECYDFLKSFQTLEKKAAY
jgi:hypothetical protein